MNGFLKMWYTHTTDYHPALKRKTSLLSAMTQINLHDIVLNERSQTQKKKCCMIPLISGIKYSNSAAAAAKSLQSCLTLCSPTDGSPPGSPIPGILQARTLEWGAVAFSNA